MYGRLSQKTRKGLTRRGFLRLSVGAALAGVAGHAMALAPYRFEVSMREVPIANLPPALDGLRVGLMSDIHLDQFMSASHLAEGVRAMNALAPDLMLLAGDYADGSDSRTRDCVRVLEHLRARLGVYAVLGNHDVMTGIAKALRQSDIRVLHNEIATLRHRGARLRVVGLGDAFWGEAHVQRALQDAAPDPEEPMLLLVHEPDYADEVTTHFERGWIDPGHWIPLQISGHSHGGQVRLPGMGAVWLPPMGERYPMGLQQVAAAERWVFTTVGFGSLLSVRWMCPPEICLLILRRGPVDVMARPRTAPPAFEWMV